MNEIAPAPFSSPPFAVEGRGGTTRVGSTSTGASAAKGMDPRVTMAELFTELWETVGTSTQTLVDAAIHFHRTLARFMGSGAPEPLDG